VNQGKDGGENHVQPPPPPPAVDLAQVMANQTMLLEAIANAINRPRPRVLGMNEKLIEFLRTKPPTFGRSVNPLDADDWLSAMLRELETFNCEDRDKVLLSTHQLTGAALDWWENYCAAVDVKSAPHAKHTTSRKKLASHAQRFQDVLVNFFLKINKRQNS
jgi:hypothetical protein